MEIDFDFTELCKIFMQIDETLTKIEETLTKVDQRITILEERLDSIENNLTDIQMSSKNMDNHISFVENLYEVFKSPFRRFISWYYRNDYNREKKIKNLDYPVN